MHRVVVLSLIFGILASLEHNDYCHQQINPFSPLFQWFFANYFYSLALVKTSVAAVNTMSAMSGVFVMCLAGIPFLGITEGDRFTISRCLVTLLRLVHEY